MNYKRYFVLFLITIFLMACASAAPTIPDSGVLPAETVQETEDEVIIENKPVVEISKPDKDLFLEAVSFLGNYEVNADYLKAKSAFKLLVKNYPKSEWCKLSETFVRIINNMLAMKEKSNSDKQLADKTQADKSRLFQENEQLKKDNEQLKKDTDQLKKDIQLLKNLEIELEKRDKALR
ncbi:MAG: hypothetical protein ABIJ37_11160 [Pseudomonadota bacterium]